MRITQSFEYAAAPDEVFAMMSSEEFQSRKCEATHALSYTVSVTPNGDGTEITTRRVMPTDGFPDFARAMTGERIAITETIAWGPPSDDGSRAGTVTLAVGDAPVGMTGDARLSPTGTGTRIEIDCELKARIPLVGGKVERAAAPAIIDAIEKEHEAGEAWLGH